MSEGISDQREETVVIKKRFMQRKGRKSPEGSRTRVTEIWNFIPFCSLFGIESKRIKDHFLFSSESPAAGETRGRKEDKEKRNHSIGHPRRIKSHFEKSILFPIMYSFPDPFPVPQF